MIRINMVTFDELVEDVTRRVHLGLIEGGGKEMKSRIYMGMEQAIKWYIESKKSIPPRLHPKKG